LQRAGIPAASARAFLRDYDRKAIFFDPTEIQMIKGLLLTVCTAGMLLSGGLAMAQHRHEEAPKPSQGMMGGGGMMRGGMMNMMQGCEQMMAARGGHAMPQLPPGNEKLQLQMHAEVMQKVGEILAKYAAQVK
jgi:hypothetical protein